MTGDKRTALRGTPHCAHYVWDAYCWAGCAGLSIRPGWVGREDPGARVQGLGDFCCHVCGASALSWTWPPEEGERDAGETHPLMCSFPAVPISCRCARNPGMFMSVFSVILPGLRPEPQEQGQHQGHTARAASGSPVPAEQHTTRRGGSSGRGGCSQRA